MKTRRRMATLGRLLAERCGQNDEETAKSGHPPSRLIAALRRCRLQAGDDEPRVPAGSPEGGEWGDGSSAGPLPEMRPVYGSDQARQAAKAFTGKNLRKLTNRDSGIIATVSGVTVGKMLSQSSGELSSDPVAHLHAVGNLDLLFPHAIYRGPRPDKHNVPEIKSMHHFDVPMPFKGEVLRLKITAKEYHEPAHGTRLYHVRTIEIGKPASSGTTPESDSDLVPPAGFHEKFDALVEKVKEQIKKGSANASRSRLNAGWITIGAKSDEDGKRSGGAHIFVDGSGDITKGPSALKGDSVASLKDKSRNDVRSAKRDHAKADDKTGRDLTRSQAQALGNQTRLKQHQAAKEAARGTRVPTHQVLRTMRDAHQFLTEQNEQREAAKSHARKLTGLNAGSIGKLENTYHDLSNVTRFDEGAQEVAIAYPDLGFDPDDATRQVWDLIKEGKQDAPKLHDRAVADLAAEWLRKTPRPRVARGIERPSKRANQRVDDTVPFRRGSGSKLRAGRMLFTGNVSLCESPANARGRARRRAKMFRTFQGVAYNGGEMFPTLTIGGQDATKRRVVLDLDTLTIPDQARPVLDDHDESTDGIIGQTSMLAVRKSDYTLPVRGILYTQKPRSQKILSASDGGHLWQLSVGVDFEMEMIPAGRQVRVNGKDFTGPLTVARNGYLTDLSFVGLGGDDTTWATIAARKSHGTYGKNGNYERRPGRNHNSHSSHKSHSGNQPSSRTVAGLQRLRATSATPVAHCKGFAR